MPIRSEDNKGRYLDREKWGAIRARILRRAGDACECVGECGETHGAVGRCAVPNEATIVRMAQRTPTSVVTTWREHGGCTLCVGGDGSCRPVVVVLRSRISTTHRSTTTRRT